ncbi:uncharacterized protein LOC114181815 [Vigna unguiculata]|uniref:UBA domain-containing protein n=1 Tax=Vigna unguiculata TaxID=3917 RepID=A0A4D6M4I8_VIGUN|nr:uncharacterized protein LOC114181815 [Vigna unguiculata]QCD95498.1 hypothetical protein DEO72_LG6g191 [Vigna unguiculata]
MSPVKSKSKSKAGKDQRNATPTTYGTSNHGTGPTGTSATAYNPVSTASFPSLETALVSNFTPTNGNTHFQKIDDTYEHPSSLQGTVSECDSVSNNGSCSGESEDPKEKVRKSSIGQEGVPGSDNDRREKIRLKNERKHQRQRERRAQELHNRCCGYLMSKKLESLAQLLVAMGFSSDRATLALMLNDGKIEESVSWLFEAGEVHTKTTTSNVGLRANLKIDVSEELVQVSDMEARYNCSKQEVERVVVACEGDLRKAENTLKSQKQESSVSQLKPEQSAKISGLNLMRSQRLSSVSVSTQQRQKVEGDFKYSRAASVFPDPQSKNLLSLHMNHQMALPVKRWVVSGSSPSATYAMVPSTQVSSSSPSVKIEVQLSSFGNKGRMFHQGMDREPVVMMQQQHPLFRNDKQDPISRGNTSPSGTQGLYANNYPAAENVRSNGMFLQNHIRGSVANVNMDQFYQAYYKEHPYVFGHVDSSPSGVGLFCKPMHHTSSPWPSIRWSTTEPSPSLTVPPSLGLFSGQSAATAFSSHSHVDWNSGGMMPEFDYTRVDWTLDCTSLSSKQGGLRLGISALSRNISGNRMSNSCMAGLQNVGMSRNTSSFSGLRDWTSPFEGNDIFSLPRSFVTSPPLMRL